MSWIDAMRDLGKPKDEDGLRHFEESKDDSLFDRYRNFGAPKSKKQEEEEEEDGFWSGFFGSTRHD